FTMVDTDTSGSYDCTLGGDDSADFAKSVSGKVCTVTFAANPNYESPADDDTDNVYDLTIAFTDGTNTLSAQTTAITITDANDQTPAVSVDSAYSQAESTSTTWETFTITDTDTTGTYTCTVAGTDAADFSSSISAKVCTIAWAAAPDYDSPADSGGNNVYDITLAFSDGTNDLSAQTTAVTVTDVGLSIADGSASLAESAANSAAVMTASITEGTASTVSIISGNTDADSDGTGPFAIATSGAITVADADDIDYETTTSYTLLVVALDDDDTVSAEMTITITDVNDQTPA
ncbi:uncharacterized protein METZ01_LOCUS391497, partial [marine metagenome]